MEILAIASDHGGFALKEVLKAHLSGRYQIMDLGADSAESVDYPVYGHKIGEAITAGDAHKAIVICGSGIGISIAVNRHAGARCALCTDVTMARLSREHNDANVLALGARMIGEGLAQEIVETFLQTNFEGGRHQRRVEQLK